MLDLDHTLAYSIITKDLKHSHDHSILEYFNSEGLVRPLRFEYGTHRAGAGEGGTAKKCVWEMHCVLARLVPEYITQDMAKQGEGFRSSVLEALDKVGDLYLCTAGVQSYADAFIELVDPFCKYFKRHRVFSTDRVNRKILEMFIGRKFK